MNKKEFNSLVQSPKAFTQTDAQAVIDLKENFPFSQMLHALSARVSKDFGFSTQRDELQMAAVYAADRNVLKEIVTGNLSPIVYHQPQIKNTPVEKEQVKISKAESRKTIDPSNLTSSGVAEELATDLKKLNQSRHNFEALFAGTKTEKAEHVPVPVTQKAVTVEKVTAKKEQSNKEEKPKRVVKKKPPIRKKATGKTKKQRIVELAKKLEAENTVEETPIEKKAPAKKKKKKHIEPADQLIDEIKTSKKKIQPENNRQKEQIELINQFIKAQPSISPQKGKIIPPTNIDFSQPSSDFGDNIISETLVKILLSQGKKEKAIEVLRKLIWKFPQKKSYFAAQIEELKQ